MLYTAGTRVTVLCAPGDMWFPDAAYSEMQQGVPGVQVLTFPTSWQSYSRNCSENP